jgi:hypothetical protein
MTHAPISWRSWISSAENLVCHIAAVLVGFAMMVLGLGMGVTMVLLPLGLVIGLLGLGIFIAGLFEHIGAKT